MSCSSRERKTTLLKNVWTRPNSRHQSYRYLDKPPLKQKLHTLYPGRLMSEKWHYTGENIPPESGYGCNGVMQDYANSHKADMFSEMQNRRLGGDRKIIPHPAIEPDNVIDDPQLYNVPARVPTDTFLKEKDHIREFFDGLPTISKSNSNVMFCVIAFSVILVLLGCVCLGC